jgi:hypothetical protein
MLRLAAGNPKEPLTLSSAPLCAADVSKQDHFFPAQKRARSGNIEMVWGILQDIQALQA